MAKKYEVPVLVKVLSILGYIVAGLMILGGIAMLLGASVIGNIAKDTPELAMLGGGLLGAIGVIFLLFGVFEIFIARGLWKGQNWARIVTIIFGFLGSISGLVSMMQGNWGSLLGLAFNLAIALYLLLNDEVKLAFA